MRSVRRGVFETNSSSTHSICIAKEWDGNHALTPKTYRIGTGEFGWEEDILSDVCSKASYLFTAALLFEDNGGHYIVQFMIETFAKHGAVLELIYPTKDEYGYDDCGIDHYDKLLGFIGTMNSIDVVERFLLSSKSFVITGNDNGGSGVHVNVNYPHDKYYKGN